MQYTYRDQNFRINRYPATNQRSLQPWSAADEHLLRYMEEYGLEARSLAIVHDRFGFLACLLHSYHPQQVLLHRSQKKALEKNTAANNLSLEEAKCYNPLELPEGPIDLVLLKIPKSLDLFHLYLHQLVQVLSDEGQVLCGFMTRHFSPQLLKVAEEYFADIQQTKAWKKSRVMVLKGKKSLQNLAPPAPQSIAFREGFLQSYPGVFSGKSIDNATRFLLEHLPLDENDQMVLDLGAGYGVIAAAIRNKTPESIIHVMDDNFLAIASARLNLSEAHTYFHFDDTLSGFPDQHFDLVVSNPPFHFEHENNIEIALGLFKEVKRCLKPDGKFILVANQHLNYKTHLVKWFKKLEILAENQKFVVYRCR